MLKTILFTVAVTGFLIGLNFAVSAQTEFTVRVENISGAEGILAQDGTRYPFALSPGVFVAGTGKTNLFRNGSKATAGVEALAEDGNPSVLSTELTNANTGNTVGIFNIPVGAGMPSPIVSGGAFEFKFTATKGVRLNFMMMYGQSNDLFYAFEKPVDIFRNGKGVSGDLTRHLVLWDAGTEVNQAPGIGVDQGPRQAAANTGQAENGTVRTVKDGFKYPKASEVIRVTIRSN